MKKIITEAQEYGQIHSHCTTLQTFIYSGFL